MPSDCCDSSEQRKSRFAVGIVLALLIIVALLILIVVTPRWARSMAVREVDRGAISEAQQWLRWSTRFPFGDDETQLMRAACFRRLGQMERWEAALQSAHTEGADGRRLEQERVLGLIRMGAHEVPEDCWRDPAGAGLRPDDAIDACVRGHLARNELDKAQQILAFWAAARPQDPHVVYLQGVYAFSQADEARALAEFEKAVARQPAHELAHIGAARLLEKQNRLAEAFPAYVRFASDCPHSGTAIIGLARVLRKLSHVEEARAVAESLNPSDPSSEFCAEMGLIELELGNYREALRWFGRAPAVVGKKKRELLWDAATAFALHEEPLVANRLFERADADEATESRASELFTQLAVAPYSKEAAEELQRLSVAAEEAAMQPAHIEQERLAVAGRDNADLPAADLPAADLPAADLPAADLYAMHCAACHGANGGGNGRAAGQQFPSPRNLRTEDYRLVSTLNANPTLEDLKRVFERGMPGTSMREFDHLSQSQLQLLAEEVLRIRREGVHESYAALLEAEDEEINEEDLREIVDIRNLPGEIVPVPSIGPADAAAVERGRIVYFESGCQPCHGDDGTGGSELALFDKQGLPAWPRDLVNEPFKGGHDPESIALRILAGMPGSFHPAINLADQKCVDLVHYCVWLSRQPKRTQTNHQRYLEATQHPLPSGTP